MIYGAMDKGGRVKAPLFADIDLRTPKYTFSYPNGLFFTSQPAQTNVLNYLKTQSMTLLK